MLTKVSECCHRRRKRIHKLVKTSRRRDGQESVQHALVRIQRVRNGLHGSCR